MTAPDIDTLYALEDHIEAAAKAVLQAEEINAYIQRETEKIVTPYVNVQLALGAATGHYFVDRNRKPWADAWTGTLGFEVVTKRSKDRDADNHGAWRSRIRRAMQYADVKFPESVLPYHTLTKIVEAGTRPQVEQEDKTDISAVSFSVIVSIRANAWPADMRQ